MAIKAGRGIAQHRNLTNLAQAGAVLAVVAGVLWTTLNATFSLRALGQQATLPAQIEEYSEFGMYAFVGRNGIGSFAKFGTLEVDISVQGADQNGEDLSAYARSPDGTLRKIGAQTVELKVIEWPANGSIFLLGAVADYQVYAVLDQTEEDDIVRQMS